MDYNNDFERQIEDAERERRKKERKEKWAKREKNFWKAFLFTEDGKPKSGLMVYTFCLSIVFVLLYIGAFNLIINWLSPVTAEWPVFAGNLVQSLTAGVVGVLVTLILHRIFSEKRLMLGTYLWLAGYILLVSVSMIFMLGDWEAFAAFLHFFAWFAVIPVALGLIVSYFLYRRDYVPPKREEDQPWKKFTQRR
ncbi:MAG: hypothetical protein K2P37_12925 [Oscillospiraceae bacterium]|nr:hypothetical protein [Oscillospiraceae bacterium]